MILHYLIKHIQAILKVITFWKIYLPIINVLQQNKKKKPVHLDQRDLKLIIGSNLIIIYVNLYLYYIIEQLSSLYLQVNVRAIISVEI